MNLNRCIMTWEHIMTKNISVKRFLSWYYKYVMVYEMKLLPIVPFKEVINHISRESLTGLDVDHMIDVYHKNKYINISIIRDYENEITDMAIIGICDGVSFTVPVYYKAIWNINMM